MKSHPTRETRQHQKYDGNGEKQQYVHSHSLHDDHIGNIPAARLPHFKSSKQDIWRLYFVQVKSIVLLDSKSRYTSFTWCLFIEIVPPFPKT